jgi:hypothetical protein
MKGGRLKDPVCLPSREFRNEQGSSITMVRFGPQEAWLNQALAGRVYPGPSVSGGVRLVWQKLKEHQEKHKRQEAGREKEEGEAIVAAAQCSRNLLSLESSSDGEAEAPTDRSPKLPKAKVFQASLGGHTFHVAWADRRWWVEGEPKALEVLSNHIVEAITPAALLRIRVLAAGRGAKAEPAQGGVQGKIHFCESKSTWVAVCKGEDGKRRFLYKGLSVQRESHGEVLAEVAYRALFREKMALAKQMWNDNDRSDAPRLSTRSSAA